MEPSVLLNSPNFKGKATLALQRRISAHQHDGSSLGCPCSLQRNIFHSISVAPCEKEHMVEPRIFGITFQAQGWWGHKLECVHWIGEKRSHTSKAWPKHKVNACKWESVSQNAKCFLFGISLLGRGKDLDFFFCTVTILLSYRISDILECICSTIMERSFRKGLPCPVDTSGPLQFYYLVEYLPCTLTLLQSIWSNCVVLIPCNGY